MISYRKLVHRAPARSVPGGGFTLLELTLVIVIMCAVLAVTTASLRRFLYGRQTGEVARQMAALAEYGRAQAAVEGRTYRFHLDPQDRCYWLTAEVAGASAELPSEFGRIFSLPQGLAARWEWPEKAAARGWVGLYPDGRTDQASILITDARGDAARVVSLSPAERLRVVEAAQEAGG